ncbi:uncharacterized protein LOC113789316 [Dermatophagoides pteronyssinus]|uniref:uncharacterized protein LOC113789316 n=1 Tax=Dermatophagoides pteronyssinus TaxID=6956 RepID=UPI003F6766B6
MSKKEYFEKFHEHIFPLFHYNRIILQKWPDFHLIEDNNYVIPKIFDQPIGRPFYHVKIPGLVTTFVGLTLFLYILDPNWCQQYSFWLIAEFAPKHGQLYTLTVSVIWSLIHMLQMFYGFGTNLCDFIFLKILNLDPSTLTETLKNDINKRHHNHKHQQHSTDRLILNIKQRQQLKSFEKRMFFGLKVISHLIAAVGYTVMAIQITLNSLWQRSIFWLIIWIFIYASWSYYICSALYQFPSIFISISYYIRLKQKSLQKRIERLNQLIQLSTRFNQQQYEYRITKYFIHLNGMHSYIMKEIDDINNQTKRITTILLICLTNLITYLTFLIFFAEMFPLYRLLFIIVYSGHWCTLLSMIYSSSKIVKRNRQFYRFNQQFLINSYSKGLINVKNFYKYISINEISMKIPFGLTLTNNVAITQNTFTTVFYNMSTILFLIMK